MFRPRRQGAAQSRVHRVLRLCSVKNRAKAQGENWVILNRQKEVQETQFSLFPIYRRLPKLDVAGSTPVSRSNFFNDLRIPAPHCAPFVLDLIHSQTFL
jgi:hypothetical protein